LSRITSLNPFVRFNFPATVQIIVVQLLERSIKATTPIGCLKKTPSPPRCLRQRCSKLEAGTRTCSKTRRLLLCSFYSQTWLLRNRKSDDFIL
jgi:hypothetical protein